MGPSGKNRPEEESHHGYKECLAEIFGVIIFHHIVIIIILIYALPQHIFCAKKHSVLKTNNDMVILVLLEFKLC